MVTLGQAIYYLRGNKQHLTQTLQSAKADIAGSMGDAKSVVASAASSMGGFLREAFTFTVGGAVLAGIQSISNGLVGLGQDAIGAYADFERLGMSLETLTAKEMMQSDSTLSMADALKAAGPEAQELVAWIEKLAVLTPFNQDDIAQSVRLAMAYNFTTDQAQRLTEATVDFAAGSGATGETIKGITTALGQMSTTGKVTAGDLNQLTTRGVAARDILSKAWGVPTSELNKMVSEGLIPADQAIEAIVASLENDFGGAAERQAHTMSGLLASMEDLKTIGLREFFTGTFQAIQPYLQRFVDFLSSPETMGKIRAFGDMIGQKIAVVLNWLSSSVIPAFSAAWGLIAPAVGEAWDAIVGIGQMFVDLADQAYTWGSGIVDQLALGIMNAAGGVIDSLGWIGEQIQYWLQPNSPPKIVPKLDQYGRDAAQLYIDSWGEADFDVFDRIGKTIDSVLQNMVDSNLLPEQGLVPMVLGSRQAVADAVEELRLTGSVGEQSFRKLHDAMGPAGRQVENMFRGLVALEKASRKVAAAQNEINEINRKFKEAANPIQDQVDSLEYQIQLLEDKKDIAELEAMTRASGITDDQRLEAQLKLESLLLKQKLAGITREKDTALSAAESKLEAAKLEEQKAQALVTRQEKAIALQKSYNDLLNQQLKLLEKISSGASGGSSGPDPAKEAARAAEAQWQYMFSIAGTDEQLRMLRERQQGYSQDQEEYWRIQQQIQAAEQQRQKELKDLEEDQLGYEESLKKTEDQLADLYAQRDAAEPGSQQYLETQAKIDELEKTRTDQLGKVKEKQQDLTDAQWDNAYAAADTAGKIAMQAEKLKGLDKNSTEYWATLTTLQGLERQHKDELERATKAADRKAGSSRGAAGGVNQLGKALKGFSKTGKDAEKDTNAVSEAIDKAKKAASDLMNALTGVDKTGREKLSPGLKIVAGVIDFVRRNADAFKGALKGIATVLVAGGVISIITSLAGLLGTLLTPFGLLIGAAALLGAAWETNFLGIRDIVGKAVDWIKGFVREIKIGFGKDGIEGAINAVFGMLGEANPKLMALKDWFWDVWNSVSSIFKSLVDIFSKFFKETWPELVKVFQNGWERAKGVVEQVLPAILGAVQTVLRVIKEFFQEHGDEIVDVLRNVWDVIVMIYDTAMTMIENVIAPALRAIFGLIATHGGELKTFIEGVWLGIKTFIESTMDVIRLFLTGINTIIKGDWETVWNGVKELTRIVWEAIWGFIRDTVGWIWDKISTVWTNIWDWNVEIWTKIKDFVFGIWGSLYDTISGALGDIWGAIQDTFRVVSDAFALTWDSIKESFGKVWAELKKTVEDTIGPIKNTVKAAWEEVAKVTEELWLGIKNKVTGIWSGVTSGLKGPINAVIGVVNGLIDGVNALGDALGLGTFPKISYLAKGTKNHLGGPSVVSEEGLEYADIPGVGRGLIMPGLYNLPSGSQITPAGDPTLRQLNSGGDTYIIQVTLTDQARPFMKPQVESLVQEVLSSIVKDARAKILVNK